MELEAAAWFSGASRSLFLDALLIVFDRPRLTYVVASDATPTERAPVSTSFRFSVNSVRHGCSFVAFILRLSLERREWVKMRRTQAEQI